MKYSVCIDMMFADLPFAERMEAVKNCGLHTVEFWKWSNKDLDVVTAQQQRLAMEVSIFNMDAKHSALSDDLSKGILNQKRIPELQQALEESIPVYRRLNARGMIVLIGQRQAEISEKEEQERVLESLQALKPIAEAEGITLLVEPLNSFDRVGYAMPYARPVLKILEKVNSPNIKLLYDMYHQHQMGDFSMEEIEKFLDRIGHFHVADCPGRHEPGTGKADYQRILSQLSRLPYDGYVGLEYRATRPDAETLEYFTGQPWFRG